ncbi:hypothetical protein CERZMDRAFT_44277, partial [Cercospora zeae-maydis SCOH1-5]
ASLRRTVRIEDHPVTPLKFPHALCEDDWIDDQFLPKGTVVIVNAWGSHNDPQ